MRVIFSKQKSADETIVRIVAREKRPGHAIVVTDDRELSERVKLLGARTIAVKEFFAGLMEKKAAPTDGKPSPSSKEGKSITDAMKKEWNIKD